MYSMDTWARLEHLGKVVPNQGRNQDPTQENQDTSRQNLNKLVKEGVQMLDSYVPNIQNWPNLISCVHIRNHMNSMKKT